MTKTACFISYCWAQKLFARTFAEEIFKQPGFDVWVDIKEILVSHHLYERLPEAIRSECDCFVALISSEYLKSENCRAELHEARRRWIQYKKPLIAIKIADCDIPFELRDIKYFDLRNTLTETGEIDETRLAEEVERLCQEIRILMELRPDLLHFFDAGERAVVYLVSNKGYRSPFPKKTPSTTTRFASQVEAILRKLEERTAIAHASQVHPDDFADPSQAAEEWMNGTASLISYGSSKINPLTDK